MSETWLLEKDMKGEHGRKVGSHLVKLSCAPLNAPSAVPDGTPSPKIPTYTHTETGMGLGTHLALPFLLLVVVSDPV